MVSNYGYRYILSHRWHISIVTCTNIHRVLSQYRIHIRLLIYGDNAMPFCDPGVKKLRCRSHVLNAKLRMKQRLDMDSHILTRRCKQDIINKDSHQDSVRLNDTNIHAMIQLALSETNGQYKLMQVCVPVTSVSDHTGTSTASHSDHVGCS